MYRLQKSVGPDLHFQLSLNLPFLAAFAEVRKANISFVMSACPSEWNNSTTSGRILMKLDILAFFENLSRKFEFY
jgi:DNA invertase Pin-like site-specific DNA recombinase